MCWGERNNNRDAQYHPHTHLSTAPCLGPTPQQQKPTAPRQDLSPIEEQLIKGPHTQTEL